MPSLETEKRSFYHTFFALQADQMKPEPTFPHSQKSTKYDCLQRWLPTIPAIPVWAHHPLHQEMSLISSPPKSGLHLWLFTNKMWQNWHCSSPRPILKECFPEITTLSGSPNKPHEEVCPVEENWGNAANSPSPTSGWIQLHEQHKQDQKNCPASPQNHEKSPTTMVSTGVVCCTVSGNWTLSPVSRWGLLCSSAAACHLPEQGELCDLVTTKSSQFSSHWYFISHCWASSWSLVYKWLPIQDKTGP